MLRNVIAISGCRGDEIRDVHIVELEASGRWLVEFVRLYREGGVEGVVVLSLVTRCLSREPI